MSSFARTPDAQASQQAILISQRVQHTSRPRSNMTTLGRSGIDLSTPMRLPINIGRAMDWASSSYFTDDIMGQLDTGLGEGGLKDGYETRAGLNFHGNYSTSSLPAYSPDQQSPVNGADASLTSYQLFPQVSSLSRQQHAYEYSDLHQNLIDPELQAPTLVHHNPPQYSAYARATSLPGTVHNSPTSTPVHNHGSIALSASPSVLPRANSGMAFCQPIPTQRTVGPLREAESETESQKSTSDVGKNRAFLRKGRSGAVYTVCPKQLYRCLYDPKCNVTKQKACDMK